MQGAHTFICVVEGCSYSDDNFQDVADHYAIHHNKKGLHLKFGEEKAKAQSELLNGVMMTYRGPELLFIDDVEHRSSLLKPPFVDIRVNSKRQKAYLCRYCPYVDKHLPTMLDHERGHAPEAKSADPGAPRCEECGFVCLPDLFTSRSQHRKVHRNHIEVYGFPVEKVTARWRYSDEIHENALMQQNFSNCMAADGAEESRKSNKERYAPTAERTWRSERSKNAAQNCHEDREILAEHAKCELGQVESSEESPGVLVPTKKQLGNASNNQELEPDAATNGDSLEEQDALLMLTESTIDVTMDEASNVDAQEPSSSDEQLRFNPAGEALVGDSCEDQTMSMTAPSRVGGTMKAIGSVDYQEPSSSSQDDGEMNGDSLEEQADELMVSQRTIDDVTMEASSDDPQDPSSSGPQDNFMPQEEQEQDEASSQSVLHSFFGENFEDRSLELQEVMREVRSLSPILKQDRETSVHSAEEKTDQVVQNRTQLAAENSQLQRPRSQPSAATINGHRGRKRASLDLGQRGHTSGLSRFSHDEKRRNIRKARFQHGRPSRGRGYVYPRQVSNRMASTGAESNALPNHPSSPGAMDLSAGHLVGPRASSGLVHTHPPIIQSASWPRIAPSTAGNSMAQVAFRRPLLGDRPDWLPNSQLCINHLQQPLGVSVVAPRARTNDHLAGGHCLLPTPTDVIATTSASFPPLRSARLENGRRPPLLPTPTDDV